MRRADTKEKILNAAVKVFAEHGFRDATIRQICSAANVNVAMVNYHFKNKEALYAEVVRKLFSFVATNDTASLASGVNSADDWKAAIRKFVEIFAGYMSVTTEPGVYAARIFRWELTRPSSICRELQVAYGGTAYEALKKLLQMALGEDKKAVKIWSAAIWGRLAMLAAIDEIWLDRFIPADMPREEWVRRIADNECEMIFKSLKYKQSNVKMTCHKKERGR